MILIFYLRKLYFIWARAFSQHDNFDCSTVSVCFSSFLCDLGVEGPL